MAVDSWHGRVALFAAVCLAIGDTVNGQSCSVKVWRKINQDKVCLGAADGTAATFKSLFTMNVELVRYVHRSGYLECEPTSGGYFGCEPYPPGSGGRSSGIPTAPPPPTTTPAPTTTPVVVPGVDSVVHHYHHHFHNNYYPRPPPQHPPPYARTPQHPPPYARTPYYPPRHAQTPHTRVRTSGRHHYGELPNIYVHHHHFNDETANGPNGDQPTGDQDPADDDQQQHDDDFILGPGPEFYQGITLFMTDSADGLIVPSPPQYSVYFLMPGINRPAWKTAITLPISGEPFGFTRDMDLKLHYGEDLYNTDESDNSGTLCVDVYAFGSLPSPPPSL